MRPIEAGLSDKDTAAILRVRRRVTAEGKLNSQKRTHILQLCDELHTELNGVVTEKTVAAFESEQSPKHAKRRKSASP